MSEKAVRLPADPASVAAARALVRDQLRLAGRRDLADDAALAVSELAANAVLHAHTEVTVHVRVTDGRARVEVHDGSAVLPVPVPVDTSALGGRGLALVASLTDRWGANLLAAGGKSVWFEVSEAKPAADTLTEQELLEAWADVGDLGAESELIPQGAAEAGVHGSPPGPHEAPPAARATAPAAAAEPLVALSLAGVDAALLLATRQHSDDLIREMTLVLLNAEARVTDQVTAPVVVRLARRLTAAAEEAAVARHQLTTAAVSALARRQPTTTVPLLLAPSSAGAAARYRDALDEADELAATGVLLVDRCTDAQRALRRWYLSEIISQLTNAGS